MTNLSARWRLETLADLASGGLFKDGDWVESKDQDPSGHVRLTQLADVGVGIFRNRSDRWMRGDQAASLNCTFLEPNDIIIARMPEPLGRACLVPARIGSAVTAVDVAILRLKRADLDPRFVMWALNSPDARSKMVRMQSGTTRKRISRKNLGLIQVPVPPLDEQRRIVEILEDHLSRLDAATLALKSDMRRTASLVASWTAASMRKEPHVPLGVLVLESRTGWDRSRAYEVPPEGHGHPYLKMHNITSDGRLDLSSAVHVSGEPVIAKTFRLQEGDLLFNNRNSAELVGKVAIASSQVAGWTYNNNIVRIRLERDVHPGFMAIQMNGIAFRRSLRGLVSASTNVAAIYTRDLLRQRVWVPDWATQQQVFEQHSELVGATGRLTEALMTGVARAGILRRSLLSAAFSGDLTMVRTRLRPTEEFVNV